MSKYNYEGSEQFKPISAWGYVGYSILFCIPIVGWIIWLVFAFSSKSINRRSYARSFFCHFLLWLIVFAALVILTHFNIGGLRNNVRQWNIPYFREAVEQVDKWLPSNDNTSSTTTTRSTEKPTTQATTKEETSTTTTAPKADSSKDSGTNNAGSASGVRKEVKEAIDGYEAFFKEYADFMKKYAKSSNPLSMMSDYTKMMTQYADNMEKWERFDKDYTMNNAELKYYTDATLRIEKMLLEAVN